MKTFGTLFSGFGGADCGLKAAGLTPVVAVEYCPKLAEVYKANHGDHVTVADVCDVDFMKLERPDWLHASPVCKEFSQAKVKGEESSLDIDAAKATCRALECWMPEVVTIENVWGYRNSKSFALICAELTRLGYWFDVHHLNSANFGVAQTRKRLILRASRDGSMPPLPSPTAWRGWYEAIEDLIPTLPESEFAKWQLDRLPQKFLDSSLVTQNNASRDNTVLVSQKPSCTVVSNFGHRPSHMPWAFVMNGKFRTCNMKQLHRDAHEPTHTVTGMNPDWKAFIMDGKPKNYAGELQIIQGNNPTVTITASQDKHPPRAWLNEGRTVKMTPRCLARFQSFPDSFELPEKDSLAVLGIGNAVPCLMMQRITEGMVTA